MTRRLKSPVALIRLWLIACAWTISLHASAAPDIPRYDGADRVLMPTVPAAGAQLRPVRYEPMLVSLADTTEPKRDASSAASIAVVYPDLGEPYRSVFAQIIEGIEDAAGAPVRQYAIGPNVDPSELRAQLKRNGIKVAITLGRQGLKVMSGLDKDIAVVAGGVLSVPEADSRNLLAVSLTPDPALLFSRLKNLLPGMRRVIVIYNPQQNEWLMRLARDAAKVHGLELVTYEARDLSSAARMYETAFAGIDGRRDAIWLPQDSTTVDEGAVLPMILKESWNRNVPVFSSSFLHVKKGVLFALYPNNVEMGRTLASSAFGVLSGDPRKRGVLPLREVNTAVNIRTASHIGLNIGYQQQRSFDYIFPEP
jgi:putative ABC transport system substrate-binding protein